MAVPFVVDHWALLGSRKYRALVVRRVRAGVALVVEHRSDNCCRRQPWPETEAELRAAAAPVMPAESPAHEEPA